jgi:hypothetical protein
MYVLVTIASSILLVLMGLARNDRFKSNQNYQYVVCAATFATALICFILAIDRHLIFILPFGCLVFISLGFLKPRTKQRI